MIQITAGRISLIAALMAAVLPVGVLAAPPTVYQPAGAPADPKVPARWNAYHDYAAATELLKQLAAAHPDYCKLQSLGLSHGGREMWVMTVTNFARGPLEDRSAFWIDGGIHANEIQATEVVLYTAWYLLESRERNEKIRQLLDDRVFYLMPMMSPDSRDKHMYEPATTHSPRSGQRPMDDDGDGLVDEDRPDDLDGDGSITQMRIRDPHGRWKSSPEMPELMVRTKPDEKGEYTLVGVEGFDNDGDGLVNEDADGNYDPNRNWPWNWQPQYVQTGAHYYPLSLHEDRLVADFISAHPHIAGAQSYHNAGGMILRGPSAKSDKFEAEDTQILKRIGERGEQLLPGYRSMEIGEELYELYGGQIDWLYYMHGVLGYTNELFTAYNYFHKKEEGFFGTPEQAQRFNRQLLFEDGFTPWREVDHPQFGKVEVGGMKKNWFRQPPSFMLEEECHRNMAFTLYHADQMPLVSVENVTVEPLAGDVFQVTATAANQRMIPTRVSIDRKNKLSPPDRVTISGEQVEVLSAVTAENRLFDKPQEQTRNPRVVELETLPGMQARYIRWLVRGKGPFTVTIESTKGGTASATSQPEEPRTE